jgi:ABC-type amino acid transport substrate-binding protein
VFRFCNPRILGVCCLVGLISITVAASPSFGSRRGPDPSLPPSIQKSGVLKVATNYGWPPFDFKGANGKGQGLDVDLVSAIAKQLGIRAEFRP